jgi:hypothetical protein
LACASPEHYDEFIEVGRKFFGRKKICDTLRAVTPFGGLSVLIEFFQADRSRQRAPGAKALTTQKSQYDPGQILVGFMLSVIVGAQLGSAIG